MIGVVMCFALADHMILRSATSARWSSKASSECRVEAIL